MRAKLAGASLVVSNLALVDLTRANLAGAGASSSGFDAAVFLGTTCPDGTNSDDNGDTCDGHF